MKTTLELKDFIFDKNKYLVRWEIKNDFKKLFTPEIIEIEYSFEVKPNIFFPLNMALSVFLVILAKEYNNVDVILPYKIPKWLEDYWKYYVKEISNGTDKFRFNINFISSNTEEEISTENIFNENSICNIGLFFGGGVESSFSLSNIYHKNPILISIVGKNWMNNDIDEAEIKFQLEESLIRDYNLNMQRIKTNARSIIKRNDEYVNKYVSGSLFYFLALPVADKYGILILFQTHELEYALNFSSYDYSMCPRMMQKIQLREMYPLFLPLYTSHSKIQMFEELSKTPFIKYLYSCFRNTDKRWCGECSKCFRISEYCERIGLDRKAIGMQEDIVGVRETSHLAKNYWIMMDKLYGRRYVREFKLALLFYLKRFKRFIKNRFIR